MLAKNGGKERSANKKPQGRPPAKDKAKAKGKWNPGAHLTDGDQYPIWGFGHVQSDHVDACDEMSFRRRMFQKHCPACFVLL